MGLKGKALKRYLCGRKGDLRTKKSFSFEVHFVISGKHILQWEGCQEPGCVVNKHFGGKLAERRWLVKEDLNVWLFLYLFSLILTFYMAPLSVWWIIDRFILLDPWECPRSGWTRLGAPWDSGSVQGWDWMRFMVPSDPNHSIKIKLTNGMPWLQVQTLPALKCGLREPHPTGREQQILGFVSSWHPDPADWDLLSHTQRGQNVAF